MKSFTLTSLILILILSFSACSNDDLNSEFNTKIKLYKQQFADKYPSAKIESANYIGYWGEIEFLDAKQNRGTAWFLADNWLYTSVWINSLADLPNAVLYSFLSSAYVEYEIIYIQKIERCFIDEPYYCIKVNLKPEGYITASGGFDFTETKELFILKDGTIVYTTSDTTDQELYRQVPEFDVNFIKEKYDDAPIVTFYNSLMRSYFIMHNNQLKQVVLYNMDGWHGTYYKLGKDEYLPDYFESYINQYYPEFTIKSVYWEESKEGKGYAINLINDEHEFTVFLP